MKQRHLNTWLQTGRLQPIPVESHRGIVIYVRYSREAKMYQYFFVSGRSGYNSSYQYVCTASAIEAAKKKIENWQQKKVY